MTNKTGLEFKVGDAVVYPAHGVGKVAAGITSVEELVRVCPA